MTNEQIVTFTDILTVLIAMQNANKWYDDMLHVPICIDYSPTAMYKYGTKIFVSYSLFDKAVFISYFPC